MNDQSAGWPPDFDEDDEEKRRAQAVQRAFMDRARRAVEREHAPEPKPIGHRVFALVAAVGLTFGFFFVVDAFISAMQKVMHVIDEQDAREEQKKLEEKKKEPMPAYVVPSE